MTNLTNNFDGNILQNEQNAQVINEIFRSLQGIFPAYRHSWPTDNEVAQAKSQWIKAFKEAGLNDLNKINIGLSKARASGSSFPPSPGEFIKWCQASMEELGFLALDQAFDVSIRMNVQFSDYKYADEKIDTVIRHVISQIGSFSYRNMAKSEAKKVFDSYYSIAIKDYLSGDLRPIARMIEDKKSEEIERQKQNSLVDDKFKNVTQLSAFAAMKKMLR